MNSEEMKKAELSEAEMEQVSGGRNINQVVIVDLDHMNKAVCPQCGYTSIVVSESRIGYCPNCHVQLVIEG